MDSPYISVIITAYNRKQYLKQAFDSVLKNNFDSIEVIVSKNFSDEKLDRHIKRNNGVLIEFKGGSIGEREANAAMHAHGEIVTFLDDDDMYAKSRLKEIYSAFSRDSELGYFHNMITCIDEEGKRLKGNGGKYRQRGKGAYVTTESASMARLMRLFYYYYPYFNSSSIAIRKDVLEENIRFLKISGKNPDSALFFSALASSKKMFFSGKPLTFYRVHQSASNPISSFRAFNTFQVESSRSIAELIGSIEKHYRKNMRNMGVLSFMDFERNEHMLDYLMNKGDYRLKAIKHYMRSILPLAYVPRQALSRFVGVANYLASPERYRKRLYEKEILWLAE